MGMQQQKTAPFLTSLAAVTITSGVMKLVVPFSSSFPQRPQFVTFGIASRPGMFDPPVVYLEYVAVIAEPDRRL